MLSHWTKAKQRTKEQLKKRHQFRIKKIREIQHEGTTYRVVKTDKGHLILFPGAKVTPESFVEMMNRENKKFEEPSDYERNNLFFPRRKRRLEWQGAQERTERGAEIYCTRMHSRCSGIFEVHAPNRKEPLKMLRRVVKPDTHGTHSTPLEEALNLHQAKQQTGFKHEVPLAVFLPKRLSRFPEMFFTTYIPNKGSTLAANVAKEMGLSIISRPQRWPKTEDVIFTGREGKGRVFVDAEFAKPTAARHGENVFTFVNWINLQREMKRPSSWMHSMHLIMKNALHLGKKLNAYNR